MANMTDEQFKQLADKLDRIITLLEVQQGRAVDPTVAFDWVHSTEVPPYQFESEHGTSVEQYYGGV